jgi:PPK2 family polyphosphate:nucleotide phosphotransferase
MTQRGLFDRYRVPPGALVDLSTYPTDDTAPFVDKTEAQQKLADDVDTLADLQSKLYAQNVHAVLVVLQGIDASGKDGTVKHVMSGVNPAGCDVKSFKVPSAEELDHDYLWRYVRALPERGKIGIFNRSYYEEVLVVRVHPELLGREHIQSAKKREKLWPTRFRDINNFEQYLTENGIEVLKFFLHLSKDEQKKRFLSRLDSADKNWKFSESDVGERAYWDDYQRAFVDMLSHTSSEYAPWYIVPADRKWFTRVVVADIIARKMESMKLGYPELDLTGREALERARLLLENEP